ncbi:MAG TPA: radical SAM protein, partial [Polyangia bacterium]
MASGDTPVFLPVPGPCDLRCAWCNWRGREPAPAADALARLRGELDRLAADGARAVGLGLFATEPTTHPALPEVIRHARGLGFERVTLSTSGLRLADRAYLRELQRAGLSDVVVTLGSLEHGLADALFGHPGATAAKLAAVENCVAEEIPVVAMLLFLRPILHGLADAADRLARTLARARLSLVHGCVADPVPDTSPARFALLWPRLGELAWTIARVRERTPGFELHARSLPLCLVGQVPGLKAEAPDPGRGSLVQWMKPPALCDGCATAGSCWGIHAGYLADPAAEVRLPLRPAAPPRLAALALEQALAADAADVAPRRPPFPSAAGASG